MSPHRLSPEISSVLEVLYSELRARQWSLSLAESCTGGLLSSWITRTAGVSDFFLGSVVSYSYEAKMKILGVHAETLRDFGAVSEQVALEMAQGVALCFGSDCQISVTGIAGPDGGTPLKPVGTVCFSARGPGFELTTTECFQGDRLAVQEQAAHFAAQLLLACLRE